MKTKAARMRTVSNIISHYNEIETDADLHREKLTLAEYRTIPITAAPLTGCKADAKAITYMSGVAAYFKKFGFEVAVRNGRYFITF